MKKLFCQIGFSSTFVHKRLVCMAGDVPKPADNATEAAAVIERLKEGEGAGIDKMGKVKAVLTEVKKLTVKADSLGTLGKGVFDKLQTYLSGKGVNVSDINDPEKAQEAFNTWIDSQKSSLEASNNLALRDLDSKLENIWDMIHIRQDFAEVLAGRVSGNPTLSVEIGTLFENQLVSLETSEAIKDSKENAEKMRFGLVQYAKICELRSEHSDAKSADTAVYLNSGLMYLTGGGNIFKYWLGDGGKLHVVDEDGDVQVYHHDQLAKGMAAWEKLPNKIASGNLPGVDDAKKSPRGPEFVAQLYKNMLDEHRYVKKGEVDYLNKLDPATMTAIAGLRAADRTAWNAAVKARDKAYLDSSGATRGASPSEHLFDRAGRTAAFDYAAGKNNEAFNDVIKALPAVMDAILAFGKGLPSLGLDTSDLRRGKEMAELLTRPDSNILEWGAIHVEAGTALETQVLFRVNKPKGVERREVGKVEVNGRKTLLQDNFKFGAAPWENYLLLDARGALGTVDLQPGDKVTLTIKNFDKNGRPAVPAETKLTIEIKEAKANPDVHDVLLNPTKTLLEDAPGKYRLQTGSFTGDRTNFAQLEPRRVKVGRIAHPTELVQIAGGGTLPLGSITLDPANGMLSFVRATATRDIPFGSTLRIPFQLTPTGGTAVIEWVEITLEAAPSPEASDVAFTTATTELRRGALTVRAGGASYTLLSLPSSPSHAGVERRATITCQETGQIYVGRVDADGGVVIDNSAGAAQVNFTDGQHLIVEVSAIVEGRTEVQKNSRLLTVGNVLEAADLDSTKILSEGMADRKLRIPARTVTAAAPTAPLFALTHLPEGVSDLDFSSASCTFESPTGTTRKVDIAWVDGQFILQHNANVAYTNTINHTAPAILHLEFKYLDYASAEIGGLQTLDLKVLPEGGPDVAPSPEAVALAPGQSNNLPIGEVGTASGAFLTIVPKVPGLKREIPADDIPGLAAGTRALLNDATGEITVTTGTLPINTDISIPVNVTSEVTGAVQTFEVSFRLADVPPISDADFAFKSTKGIREVAPVGRLDEAGQGDVLISEFGELVGAKNREIVKQEQTLGAAAGIMQEVMDGVVINGKPTIDVGGVQVPYSNWFQIKGNDLVLINDPPDYTPSVPPGAAAINLNPSHTLGLMPGDKIVVKTRVKNTKTNAESVQSVIVYLKDRGAKQLDDPSRSPKYELHPELSKTLAVFCNPESEFYKADAKIEMAPLAENQWLVECYDSSSILEKRGNQLFVRPAHAAAGGAAEMHFAEAEWSVALRTIEEIHNLWKVYAENEDFEDARMPAAGAGAAVATPGTCFYENAGKIKAGVTTEVLRLDFWNAEFGVDDDLPIDPRAQATAMVNYLNTGFDRIVLKDIPKIPELDDAFKVNMHLSSVAGHGVAFQIQDATYLQTNECRYSVDGGTTWYQIENTDYIVHEDATPPLLIAMRDPANANVARSIIQEIPIETKQPGEVNLDQFNVEADATKQITVTDNIADRQVGPQTIVYSLVKNGADFRFAKNESADPATTVFQWNDASTGVWTTISESVVLDSDARPIIAIDDAHKAQFSAVTSDKTARTITVTKK
ncbi:MAG: hypothetical protein Q8P95_00560 [bacterium]|nr:hypothetical protein [bacterium]